MGGAGCSFASFVSHVAFLEQQLRTDGTVFIDTYSDSFESRVKMGKGVSFRVEKAEWRPNHAARESTAADTVVWGKLVALKTALTTAVTSRQHGR